MCAVSYDCVPNVFRLSSTGRRHVIETIRITNVKMLEIRRRPSVIRNRLSVPAIRLGSAALKSFTYILFLSHVSFFYRFASYLFHFIRFLCSVTLDEFQMDHTLGVFYNTIIIK